MDIEDRIKAAEAYGRSVSPHSREGQLLAEVGYLRGLLREMGVPPIDSSFFHAEIEGVRLTVDARVHTEEFTTHTGALLTDCFVDVRAVHTADDLLPLLSDEQVRWISSQIKDEVALGEEA